MFVNRYVTYLCMSVFFVNDTATNEIYTYVHTLSLHDALPICPRRSEVAPERLFYNDACAMGAARFGQPLYHGTEHARRYRKIMQRYKGWPNRAAPIDRKSTRLKSSH